MILCFSCSDVIHSIYSMFVKLDSHLIILNPGHLFWCRPSYTWRLASTGSSRSSVHAEVDVFHRKSLLFFWICKKIKFVYFSQRQNHKTTDTVSSQQHTLSSAIISLLYFMDNCFHSLPQYAAGYSSRLLLKDGGWGDGGP